MAAEALTRLGIECEAVRERFRATISPATKEAEDPPPFTPRAKTVLELSLREALNLHHRHIGTEHILLALITEGQGLAPQVLSEMGVDLEQLRTSILAMVATPVRGSNPGRFRWRPGSAATGAGAMPSPLCSSCSHDLAVTAAYKVLDVRNDQGEEPVKMIAYCRQCGAAIGTAS